MAAPLRLPATLFRPHPLAVALCCALGTAWTPGVQAQAQADIPLAPVEVSDQATADANGLLPLNKTVGTASRLGLTARETPASVHIVDRTAIEARGAQDTQEILRSIPGVTAYSPPGNIGISYRGFGTGSVSQLFNGINLQYSIAARPVDSWIYDRVEAVGGASGFLYGAGGVGGTLNYITKLAQRDSFTEGQLRLGSYGLKEASVGLNRRLGDATDSQGTTHYLRLDLNHRDAGSWVGGTQSRSTQLATSLLSDLGGGLTHTLAYEAQHERVDRPYWGTPLLNPLRGQARIDEATLRKNYNSADGLYAQRVQWLRSITEWRASDRLKLSNTFYAYDALRDYRNVETYRFTPDNSAVVRSAALLQRHDQRMVGDRIEGSYLGELAGRRSEWAFGLDVSVNRQTRFPNSLSGTVSTVNPYDFTTENFYDIPGMAPGFRPDRDNKVTTTALYLENRTALTPALHLLTALRHERIEVDLTNRRDVTPALPASYSRSYSPTTGRVGLVWDATPEANLYAQFSTAADPPSGMLMGASFADAINNTGLTTGRQVEAGSKLSFWQGKGTAALAVYRITRRNISTQDPQDSTRTVLVGQQSSRGVELSMGLAPTPRWSIQGNWSHVDARYDNYQQGGVSLAGKRPTNTPASVLNLWTSYRITPALEVNAGLRRVGGIYTDAANTLSWPAYTLLDLGLSYRIDPRMTVVARLRNATDRVYAASLTSTMAYLGAPRTADITLRVAF
ncbi:TonB-dependent receptor [Delftia sp. DT-2]|uniref:TonB-dependent receptor n=1 Tax=Delftia sp. DT-2 TaxID=3022772 RepID=UPI00233F0A98|nr:TonB-dependent siderophore receptor [Delftia sp. DT-2]MDC2861991.1 TonB-dependent siderophore receptor [Delftia sp. DT-2]